MNNSNQARDSKEPGVTFDLSSIAPKDLRYVEDLLVHLNEGWSIGRSRRLAKISDSNYKYLRAQYPLIDEIRQVFMQSNKQGRWE